MLGFKGTEQHGPSETIEQALSEMFRELLESIKAEIEERSAQTVRTFEIEAKPEENQQEISFEVAFEPVRVAVNSDSNN